MTWVTVHVADIMDVEGCLDACSSNTTKENHGERKTKEFDVSVDGIDELKLLTLPTDDGPGSDWGLWLEPVLRRSKVD